MNETTSENQSEEIAKARERYVAASRRRHETSVAVLEARLDVNEAEARLTLAQEAIGEADVPEEEARQNYYEILNADDEDEDEDEDEEEKPRRRRKGRRVA